MQNQTPKNWQKVKFGQVATLHRGYDLPIEKITKGDHPVIFSNGKIEYHNEYKIKGPGVITGRSGSLGNTFYIEDDYWPHNTTLFVSDFHGNNPKFIYFLLKTLNFSFLNVGTGIPTLNRNHVHEILVKIPVNHKIQKQIVSILSAYDDLIENNNNQIKILEEMAQDVFKEWFVHFRFPGYEKVKMVDSPLGKIPEGWVFDNIGDKFSTILGGTPSRINSKYWENGSIPWINSGKTNELRITSPSEYITEDGLKHSSTKLMPKRATVIAITGATLGQVSLLEIECSANQSVIGIYDNSTQGLFNEYIYLFINNNIHSIINKAGGGAQQHINKEIVEETKILVPSLSIMRSFKDTIEPTFDLLANLIVKNELLQKTRDLLLPKLMRGELRVN